MPPQPGDSYHYDDAMAQDYFYLSRKMISHLQAFSLLQPSYCAQGYMPGFFFA